MNAMESNPQRPEKLSDLSEDLRLVLAAFNKDDVRFFRAFMNMRDDERETLLYLATEFTKTELTTVKNNLENMRAMARFGKFAAFFFGVIATGAAAATAVKTFFYTGMPR